MKQLARLAKHIFVIERKGAGQFELTEACDHYFSEDMSAAELRELSAELLQLADDPAVEPPL